jgi:hypothetical protein
MQANSAVNVFVAQSCELCTQRFLTSTLDRFGKLLDHHINDLSCGC